MKAENTMRAAGVPDAEPVAREEGKVLSSGEQRGAALKNGPLTAYRVSERTGSDQMPGRNA